MVWKFCEICKIVWELSSRLVKFCEILSRSVRYGRYATMPKCRYSYIAKGTSFCKRNVHFAKGTFISRKEDFFLRKEDIILNLNG